MRRGIKIGLIIGVIAVIVVGVIVLLNFTLFRKDCYRIIAIEMNNTAVADLAGESELKFYNNGTFHVCIKHQERGLALLGIGTYTYNNNEYHLQFNKVYGRDLNDNVVELTDYNNITCTRSGGCITFVDHKKQVYKFG